MKKLLRILAPILIMTALLTNAPAQQRLARQNVGRGYGQSFSRMFNPQTIVTVKGMVEEVEQVKLGRGRYYGLHIRLATESDLFSVHLGPAWFIEQKNVKIEKGDTIEIKGSKIIYNNNPAIIASKITIGDQLVLLRNDAGIPAWSRSGAGRRRQ